MATGMTIKEVKKKRMELEEAIMDLVKKFHDETGVTISYFDMNWDYGDKRVSTAPAPESPEKRTLRDISVNLDFDAAVDM